jgi:hypothetical protein
MQITRDSVETMTGPSEWFTGSVYWRGPRAECCRRGCGGDRRLRTGGAVLGPGRVAGSDWGGRRLFRDALCGRRAAALLAVGETGSQV